MAKFSPHDKLHSIINRLRLVNGALFWTVFVLSISSALMPTLNKWFFLKEIINVVNIISILAFFILDVIIEYILFPLAENKRREDYIDNSLGSKHSLSSSQEYYDNDEVSDGLYKIAVNLFQNTFYSCFIVKSLTWRRIVFPTIVLLSIWVMAYYGFRQVPFALTLLQVFFSAQILGNLVKHLILVTQLDRIQGNMIRIFQQGDVKSNLKSHKSEIYLNWLSYETLLSRIQPEIPEAVFKQVNQALLEQWKELKNRYSIH